MKPVTFFIVVLAMSLMAGCASQRPAPSTNREPLAKLVTRVTPASDPVTTQSVPAQEQAQGNKGVQAEIPDDEALYQGAMKTYQAYRTSEIDAMRRGTPFIPLKCWDEKIRALNPIYVYLDKTNIVVVQSREYLERGLYITNMISSYAPMIDSEPNQWGFTFSPRDAKQKREGTRVHAFTRDLNHQVQ